MPSHFLHCFEQQVEKQPNASALIFNDLTLSYAELNYKANQLAHVLQEIGVGPNVTVGVSLERSFELIIAILAILKAGGAYVPLDQSYPPQRLEYMVNNSRVSLLLTQQNIYDAYFRTYVGEVLCVDQAWDKINQAANSNLKHKNDPADCGYIIYTSGSTGQPKGIVMPLQALSNLIAWQQQELATTSYARILQFAPISFDVSFQEIFTALCGGKTLVLINEVERQDFFALAEIIQKQQIEILFLPYVALEHLCESALHAKKQLDSLKMVITAGEQLKITSPLIKFFQQLPHCQLCNQYGPAETHVVTAYYLPPNAATWPMLPPIGKPIANTEIYLLDQELQSVAFGQRGEIFIGGICVAKGYIGRDDLTEKRFIWHAIDDTNAQLLYRTGDLACYLPDGNIEFLGRTDSQIKIHGHRIEVGEIETLICEHPAIHSAVIKSCCIANHKRLVAYLETDATQGTLDEELRQQLSKQLPAYMLPYCFVYTLKLPLTPSGKVDRESLVVPDVSKLKLIINYLPPETPTENKLAQIWGSLFGVSHINRDDNFFKLGGYSLLATKLIIALRDNFNIHISLVELFQFPVLQQLAEYIDATKQKAVTTDALTGIVRAQYLPVSLQQEQLWLIATMDPTNPAYNESLTIYFHQTIDPFVLEQSLNVLLERHEILRTSFAEHNGEPIQIIQPKCILPLAIEDFSQLNANEREVAALDAANQMIKSPIDITKAPLLRALLVKFADDDFRLYIAIHHIIFDGESYLIFMHELEEIYSALKAKRPIELAPLLVQFADFAIWQRQIAQTTDFSSQEKYWRKQLADLPKLNLPTDRCVTEKPTLAGKVQHFVLPRELVKELNALIKQQGITLYLTLLTTVIILLYRYCGQTDIPIFTVTSKRNQSMLQNVIGYVLDNLMLRINVDETVGFAELLEKVQAMFAAAYANKDIPFAKLVQIANPERRLGQRQNPLAQVAFSLEPEPTQFSKSRQGWEFKHMRFHCGTVKTDLYFEFEQTHEGVIARIEYSSELFDDETINRMFNHLQTLLRSIVANPTQSVATLNLIPEDEKQQLLRWSEVQANLVPDLCVQQIFEQHVATSQDALAISFMGETLTYQQLNEKANRLANYLISIGVKPKDIVAICMERSIEFIVSALAILKASAAYAAIEPNYPEQRIAYILADTSTSVLITTSQLKNKLAEFKGEVLCYDELQLDKFSADSLSCRVTPDDLVYLIYTSGSTGTPKGIKVAHKVIVKLSINNVITIDSNDRVAHAAALSFDVAAYEIWSALLNGAAVVIVPKEILLIPHKFRQLLNYEHVTHAVFPAGLLNQLIRVDPALLRPLKYVLTGGEKANPNVFTAILKGGQPQHLINIYAPSEAAMFVTIYKAEVSRVPNNIPIGKPIAHSQVYILDKYLQMVPIGIPGEICLGGELLSYGYLNKEELTNEVFVAHPLYKDKHKKIYRTGDVGRLLPDGNIEFLYRRDHQIKIRGFRVEVGEIVAALSKLPGVKQAYVHCDTDTIGSKYLIAYVVLQENIDNKFINTEVKNLLQQKLPDFMVPRDVIIVDTLPLNPHGKVDDKKLPKYQGPSTLTNTHIAPTSAIELNIVTALAKILNIPEAAISMNQSFFAIGGNSLLAMQLIANLSSIFNLKLDLAILLQANTLQELASRIKLAIDRATIYQEDFALQTKNTSDLLIKICEGDNILPPMFFAAAGGGQVLFYRNLIKYLPKELTIYGLRAIGFEQNEKPLANIEEIAEKYIEIIKSIQPQGPYFLAGASSGGLIVYEMAQQLRAKDDAIALLAIIDSPAPAMIAAFDDPIDIMHFFFHDVLHLPITRDKLIELGFADQINHILTEGKKARIFSADYKAEHIEKVLAIFKATCDAIMKYQPKPFDGAGWYIKAKESGLLINYPHEQEWQKLIADFKLTTIDGDHISILQEPRVKFLAEHFVATLKSIWGEILDSTSGEITV